jgi:membrane protease YdiL (CAAX protease family)
MGYWAILVQTLLFGLFLSATGSLSWLTAPALSFAPFAGYIVHKTGSLVYSILAHWLFVVIIDVTFLVLQ